MRSESSRIPKTYAPTDSADEPNNQMSRIKDGFDSGTLSADQAKQLRGEVRSVRQQERQMASLNGGHLTPDQKKALNQELNGISKEIGPAAPAAPAAPVAPGVVTSDPANNLITTHDGSTIKADPANAGFLYTDAKTGQSTFFGGDPHAYENATDSSGAATFSVQGPFKLRLNDGSVLNVQTTPPDANGATVISSVDVIGPGNHRATMSGIDSGQVSTSGVSTDGASYRAELGSGAAVLSNRGTLSGEQLGGANWTSADPTDGVRKQITGGDDVGSWTFGNAVD